MRDFHRFLTLFFGIFPLLALLAACEDDERAAPAYRKDLVEAFTNADGAISRVVRDNGDTLLVGNPRAGYVADSLYRCMAIYVADEEQPNRIHLYGVESVLSGMPVLLESESVVCDPVEPLSIWCGGNYLNLRLDVKVQNRAHYYGFVYDGIGVHADSSHVLLLTLYHHRNGDAASFTRQVTLSCPLAWLGDNLRRGRDSVRIWLNSDSEGIIQRTVPF